MPDWRVFSLFRQHMQLNRIKIWTWQFGPSTLHMDYRIAWWILGLSSYEKSMKMESFLLIENSTSLIVIIKISDLHNAYTDCVPSWTANYIRNSGDDYSTKRKNAVWSCGSSMNCKIWATAFSSVIWQDWWKNPYNWTKKRKYYPFILILFLQISIWPFFLRIFNPSTLIFPHLNPMDYRET